MREIERQVMLQIIDQRWREHLYEMDYLQEGINLRAMGQKDPLVEWQREGFEMFGDMMQAIAQDFVQVRDARRGGGGRAGARGGRAAQRAVLRAERSVRDGQPHGAPPPGRRPRSKVPRPTRGPVADWRPTVIDEPVVNTPVVKHRVVEKTGRNEPCPCGSGKKFKQCHGA